MIMLPVLDFSCAGELCDNNVAGLFSYTYVTPYPSVSMFTCSLQILWFALFIITMMSFLSNLFKNPLTFSWYWFSYRWAWNTFPKWMLRLDLAINLCCYLWISEIKFVKLVLAKWTIGLLVLCSRWQGFFLTKILMLYSTLSSNVRIMFICSWLQLGYFLLFDMSYT